MNKEEIKEYLKRADLLELKLTGEDRETYQWVLFGYNECARLLEEKEQQNKELHNKIDKAIEILNNPWSFESGNKEVDEITYQKKREIIEILKDSDVDE